MEAITNIRKNTSQNKEYYLKTEGHFKMIKGTSYQTYIQISDVYVQVTSLNIYF